MEKTFQQVSEAVPSKLLPSDFLQICPSTNSHALPTGHPKSSCSDKLPAYATVQPGLLSSPYQLDSHLLHSAMANSASRQIQDFFFKSDSSLLSSAEESSERVGDTQSNVQVLDYTNSQAMSEAKLEAARGSLNIDEVISVPSVDAMLNHQSNSRLFAVQPPTFLVHKVPEGKTDIAVVLSHVEDASAKFSEEKNSIDPQPRQSCITLSQSDAQPRQSCVTLGQSVPQPRQSCVTLGQSVPQPRQSCVTLGQSVPQPRQSCVTLGQSDPQSRQNCVTLGQSDAHNHLVLASDCYNSGLHPAVYLPQNQASSKLYAFAKMVDSHLNVAGQETSENLSQEFTGKRINVLSSDTRLYMYQTENKKKDINRSFEEENTSVGEENVGSNKTDPMVMKNVNQSESGSVKDHFPLVNKLNAYTTVDINCGIDNQDKNGSNIKHNESNIDNESREKPCDCIKEGSDSKANDKLGSGSFICGSCCRSFQSICYLHTHLNVHSPGGSYHYDHVSQTAFPKFDTVCSYTQTECDGIQVTDDNPTKSETDRDILEFTGKGASMTKVTSAESEDLNIHQPTLDDMTVANVKRTAFLKHSRKQDNKKIKQNIKPNGKIMEIKTRKQSSATLNEIRAGVEIVSVQKVNLDQQERSEVVDINKETSMSVTDSEIDEFDDGKRYEIPNEIIDMSDNNQKSECFENSLANSQDTAMLDDTTEGSMLVKDKVAAKKPCKKRKQSFKTVQHYPNDNTGKNKIKSRKHAKRKNTPEKCVPMDSNSSQNVENSDGRNLSGVYNGNDINGKEIPEFSETVQNLEKDKVTKVKKTKEKIVEPEGKKDKYEICSECGLTVARNQFVFHMRQHSGERPFICEKCGKSFARCRFLTKHLITHEEDKPWKCELCPSQFCQKNEYNMHVAGHVDDRPHKCNVCEMRFLSKTSLHTHQANIHMGLTRFECDVCKRRFYKRSSLNVHVATHFEPTLKCNFCDKKFRDKTGRKRHERIHTGVKMFKCHVCDHSFIQSTPYWIHMEKHHSMSRDKIKEMLKTIKEQNRRAGVRVETITLPPEQNPSVSEVANPIQEVQNLSVQKSAVMSAVSKPSENQSSHLLNKISSAMDKMLSVQQQKGQGHGQQIVNIIPDVVSHSSIPMQKSFPEIKAPSRHCDLMSLASESHGAVDMSVADMFASNHHALNTQNDDITLTARHYGITVALPGETSNVPSASSQPLVIPELDNNMIHQMVSLGGHSLNSLPIGLGSIATPTSSAHHSFIGFNPLQQALEISHTLPPSSSYTDISNDRVMDE